MQKIRSIAAWLSVVSLIGVSGVAGAADEKAQTPTPAPAQTAPAQPAPSPSAAPAQAAPVPDPVAVVNGVPLSRALYNAYAQQRQARMGDADTPEGRQALIDMLVSHELLLQQAQKQKLLDDPQVAQQIEMMKRNVLFNAVLRKVLADKAPSEADIKKEYDKMIGEMGKKEYKARHILVDSEDKAKSLTEQLKKGGNFAELAKANSSDGSAAEGGDLGWFTPDMMAPAFGEAVSKLQKGKFTEQPVKTEYGWHIILLEDVRDTTPPPLEEVRPQIMQALQSQIISDYLDQLRKEAKVEIK